MSADFVDDMLGDLGKAWLKPSALPIDWLLVRGVGSRVRARHSDSAVPAPPSWG